MLLDRKSGHIPGIVGYYARHITPIEAQMMLRFCGLRRHGWLTGLFRLASRLGDGPLWWSTGLTLLAVGDAPMRWAVLAAALAICTSVLLFMAVKNLIGRPRPYEVWAELPCLLAPPDKFSFPSGHTMTAFAVTGVYAVLIPGSLPIFFPAALLIGLSRVFLGVHYPTDVLVGALLGSGLGLGMGRLFLALL